MPAELAAVVHQHRDVLAVALPERRIAIDVHHFDFETTEALQTAQGLEHLAAQVAPGAAVEGQQPITHPGGTECRGNWRRGAPAARRCGPCRTAPSSG